MWQAETEKTDNPFRYCGEYLDEETGNYYLRARYYDPSIQRFITEDSYKGEIKSPLSLNLYTYCQGNPIMYTDPSGHEVTSADRQALRNGKITQEEFNTLQNATETFGRTEDKLTRNTARSAAVEIRKKYNPKYVDKYDYTYGGTYNQNKDIRAKASEALLLGLSSDGRDGMSIRGKAQFNRSFFKGRKEIVEASSPNKLQKAVEKGQAPRGVERIDKPHVPGQKPHVHFEDGSSLNIDGTVHDAHKGTPNPSKAIKKWLENNGWKVGR